MTVLAAAERPPTVPERGRAADEDRRATRLFAAAWVTELVAALTLWAGSLSRIRVDALGDYGLLPELGVMWYVATAWLVVGAVWLLGASRARPLIAAAYIAALVLVLYGTVALVSDTPHYPWTYKHIGVTRYIAETGSVDPSIDIYHRWPGFFALSAFFSSIAGRANPIAYAAWAEPFFALVSTVLVGAAARILTRSARIAGLAALLYVITNWVNQLYFAPQALSFTLSLAIVVLVLRGLLSSGAPRPPRIARLLRRIGARPPDPAAVASPPWRAGTSVAAVLLLYGVVVATHQLTPYVLLAGVLGLALVGLRRPFLLLGLMSLIALAFLLANLPFLRDSGGLLSGFNPFRNLIPSASGQYDLDPVAGKLLNTRATHVLTAVMWLGGAAAAFRLWRIGRGREALPFAVLVAAPFSVLFVQNYGGEAIYRVYLFSVPWCACLIAWAIASLTRPLVRLAAVATLVVPLAIIAVPALLGQEEIFTVSPAEVRASEHLYDQGRAGSAVVLAGPYFPTRYSSAYATMLMRPEDPERDLLADPGLRERLSAPTAVDDVARTLEDVAPHGYLVFTDTQVKLSRILGLLPPGTLTALERAIASSPRFRLWYGAPGVRIYEYPGRVRPRPGPGRPDPSQDPPAPAPATRGPGALWDRFPLEGDDR